MWFVKYTIAGEEFPRTRSVPTSDIEQAIKTLRLGNDLMELHMYYVQIQYTKEYVLDVNNEE